MCVLLLYVSKRKNFLYLTKYSRLLLDWPRTAHSICVTSEEKQVVHMQMSRSEIEKREPLISVLFACVELFRKRPLSWNNDAAIHQSVRLPVARASCVTAAKWVYAHDNHTHGQLIEFDTLSQRKSQCWFIQLYTANIWLCVCFWDGARPHCSATVIILSSRIFWMNWLNRFTMSYSKG